MPFIGPQTYLIGALIAALVGTYVVMNIKRDQAIIKAHNVGYSEGHKIGAGAVAAETTASANQTIRDVEQGEREAEPVPADKAKIIELCKRSASCRDRGRLANVSRETEPRK
jgi:hypothetical protein